MKICRIYEITEDMQKEIDLLLHELSPDFGKTDLERINGLLKSERLFLFAAMDEKNQMKGMLTLTYCPTLTYDKFWIEDVIVSPDSRGQGIGRELVHAALEHSGKSGIPQTVYLTSNPSRTAARNLYRSEGFEEYETGVFRIKI